MSDSRRKYGKSWLGALGLVAALAAGSGCAATAATDGAADERGPAVLEGKTWVLVEISSETAPVDPPITAEFESDGIVGSAGCNNYRASATYPTPGAIQVGMVSATKKLCPGTIMQGERVFLDALNRVIRYAMEEDRLVLSYSSGGTGAPGRLVFEARGATQGS
jgi:heat shock protein HslJ